ncbi:MAG: magnesium/cobalt transporter CorA [Spirochaetia bacterium]|nr:magnesium/cobalt transporter CorA [Spirochaetia bacterium]
MSLSLKKPLLKRKRRSYGHKVGLPPGSLFDSETHVEPQYEMFHFNADEYQERQGYGTPEFQEFEDKSTVTWLNIVGVGDKQLLQKIGEKFKVHPVVLEDIQNTEQRPKIEDYGSFLFFTLKMMRWSAEEDQIISEQLSVIVGSHFVISFQEQPGDVFHPVRTRIREGKGRVRGQGADYLAYGLLDLVIDNYFLIMEQLEVQLEDIEEAIVDREGHRAIENLQAVRKKLILIRRAVWPLREVMNQVQKQEFQLIEAATRIYFKDLYDHVLHIIDTLELMKETSSALADSYQTELSNDLNSVMKVLTIIATIFIPLTFIAGVYGMNFEHMPELAYPWAYPAVLGVMGIVAVVMLFFFKYKKWL